MKTLAGRVLQPRSTESNIAFLQANLLVIALVALCVYFTTQSSAFLTTSNFKLLLTNNAPLGVLAAVFAVLVIAGHVDLSVGSNIALSGLVASLAAASWGLGGWGIIIGMAVGAGVGAVNGLMCAILRFNPIIATLGMLGVIRGVALLIRQDEVYGLGHTFDLLGNHVWAGLPILLWVTLIVFALVGVFLVFTPWGRHTYAIGVNPEAAFYSGLRVRTLPFLLYVATGVAAGLAGVMISARVNGAAAGTQGLQMELQALTVILLGGVAFAGGRGRLLGVVTAWAFLSVLQDGLILMNVTPYVQMVTSGIALVMAAALDAVGAGLAGRVERRRRVMFQQRSVMPLTASESPGHESATN